MTVDDLEKKWNSGILGYPTAQEIDFLFAEVRRLGEALAGCEKLLREQKGIDKVVTE